MAIEVGTVVAVAVVVAAAAAAAVAIVVGVDEGCHQDSKCSFCVDVSSIFFATWAQRL
jgi:hypothetical protein